MKKTYPKEEGFVSVSALKVMLAKMTVERDKWRERTRRINDGYQAARRRLRLVNKRHMIEDGDWL